MTNFLKASGLALGATVLAAALSLIAATVFRVFDRGKRRKERRGKREKLSRNLVGRSLDEALEASRYDYAHFQGEDGYRIFQKVKENGFVGFAATELDAQLRIVERSRGSCIRELPRQDGGPPCP